MLIPKNKPIRDKRHLDFIRRLVCATCLAPAPSEACHIRAGGDGGMGMKPGDNRTIPQCHSCHMESHTGEKRYWVDMRLPIELSNALYVQTGDRDAAMFRIMKFAREFKRVK